MSTRFFRCGFLLAVSFTCCCSQSARAQGNVDRIRLKNGSSAAGEIVEMSPFQVTIAPKSGSRREVPVNEIGSIIYKGEPSELTQARINAAGGYQSALQRLAGLKAAEITRDLIKQDVEFYRAYCAARLALAGNGSINSAGKQMGSFVRDHRDNYHRLEAIEVLGDLLSAAGRYETARQQYAEVGKAPWPEYKLRSAVLVGRALQAQGKHNEALQQFESALNLAGDVAESDDQRLAAVLGQAISLAETGQGEQAITMIERVIQDADPENGELHALAYNALGKTYQQSERTNDALLAYLHVDVLYSVQAEAHAEALWHLSTLWESVGQEGRARDARQLLKERYGASRWARQR